MTAEGQPVDAAPAAAASDLWVSISDLGALKGVSKAAISKRVLKFESDGLINVRHEDGKKLVNLVEFDRLIGANTDPAQELRNGGHIAKPMPQVAADPTPQQSQAEQGSDSGKPQYSASRALRESYDAENARLDLEERTKRLVDKEEAEARIFRIFRRVRDRFLSMSAVVAPRIYAAVDERTARQIMDEEVRKALSKLADELDHDGDVDDADDDAAEELSDAAGGDRGAT